MSYDDYKREQDVIFQTLQHSEDEREQRERRRQRERLRTLRTGLKKTVRTLMFFESQDIDIVGMPQEILSAFKTFIPELWNDPHAEPMIRLLFPNPAENQPST